MADVHLTELAQRFRDHLRPAKLMLDRLEVPHDMKADLLMCLLLGGEMAARVTPGWGDDCFEGE